MANRTAHVTVNNEDADRDLKDMDIVYICDKGGNRIKFQMFEGKHYLPYYRPSDLKAIKTFELRSDDIYLSAYPRTGTHWVFEMSCMLLNGKAETIPKSKTMNQLEVTSAKDLALLPSPRVLNTHMRLSDAPKQLKEKKCKIIYNIRDPKDVAVSLYNACLHGVSDYQGDFKDFLYLFLEDKVECDGLFGHFLDAEKFFDDHPETPVHLQIYEETVQDTARAVQKLSDFLGVERDNGLCEAIAKKCEFHKLKNDKDAYAFKSNGKNFLYRKGIIGDWKNWFTEEMLEDYYRVYEEKMAGSRFYETYAQHKH